MILGATSWRQPRVRTSCRGCLSPARGHVINTASQSASSRPTDLLYNQQRCRPQRGPALQLQNLRANRVSASARVRRPENQASSATRRDVRTPPRRKIPFGGVMLASTPAQAADLSSSSAGGALLHFPFMHA